MSARNVNAKKARSWGGNKMNNIPWSSSWMPSIKVIESPLAVERKVKYRAVAVVIDQRRPNMKKPIYKRKRFETIKPIAYLLNGNTLIIHPDLMRALEKKMGASLRKSIDDQIRDLFLGSLK